jgi:hypothetical protein
LGGALPHDFGNYLGYSSSFLVLPFAASILAHRDHFAAHRKNARGAERLVGWPPSILTFVNPLASTVLALRETADSSRWQTSSLTTISVCDHNFASAAFERRGNSAAYMFGCPPERIVIKVCIALSRAGLRVP